MIELVFLGSLVLFGLHLVTRKTSPAPVRRPKKPAVAAAPDAYEFEIEYEAEDGTRLTCRISSATVQAGVIHARSDQGGDQQMFDNGSILACKNLRTGRAIKDLGKYLRGRAASGRAAGP